MSSVDPFHELPPPSSELPELQPSAPLKSLKEVKLDQLATPLIHSMGNTPPESEQESTLEAFPSLARLNELESEIRPALAPEKQVALAKELAMIQVRSRDSPPIQQKVEILLSSLKEAALVPAQKDKMGQISLLASLIPTHAIEEDFDTTLDKLLQAVPLEDTQHDADVLYGGDLERAKLHIAKRLLLLEEGASYPVLKAISKVFGNTFIEAVNSKEVQKILAHEHAFAVIGKQIGQGGQRTVHLAETFFKNQENIEVRSGVIKLPMNALEQQAMNEEAAIMLALKGQPGIIGFHTYNGRIVEELAGFETPTGKVIDAAEYSRPTEDRSAPLYDLTESEQLKFYGELNSVIDGLKAMRDRGITFRDLKPENILMMPDGSLRISDFGFAVQGTPQDAKGTILYMAPEMLQHKASEKSDVWAFGITLMDILGFIPPENHAIFASSPLEKNTANDFKEILLSYTEGSPIEAAEAYASNYPEPEDHVSFDHLIWSCTRLTPEERPTLEELQVKFNQILDSLR